MTSNIRTTLAAFAPELATDYSASVRAILASTIAQRGPSCRGDMGAAYSNLVRPVLAPRSHADLVAGIAPKIDESLLTAASFAAASAALSAAADKAESKVADLANVACSRRPDAACWDITGTRADGRSVRIEQTIIVNVSSKGTVFNQFPARIYLDGRLISEAAYKRLA